ncbi:hypothetical protein [Maricaulis sp.]|uniref:hypothetical protein n=1 Tax=Maricaulis sp. TaxID=1486257 RepID=UPI003298B1F7
MRLLLAAILSLALQSGAFALGGGGGGGGGGNGGHGSSGGGNGNRFLLVFNRSAENEDEHGASHESDEDEVDDDPRAFNLPALVAPLSRDGRLTGFAYVHVRVRAADGQNVWSMQENAHYALDALVRAAYRIPVSRADGQQLDISRAEEVWSEVLREQYGADAIDHIEIRSSDTRLLMR